MKKIIFLFLIVMILFSCGKKEEKVEPITQMKDEHYVDYIVTHFQIKIEMEEREGELKNNPELMKKFDERLEKLEKRYPNAAKYPTTLTQEEQNKLGEKVEEALKNIGR